MTRVWTGSDVPVEEQGIIILGTPSGHDQFVRTQLELKSREHDLFLSRIPSVADLQSVWDHVEGDPPRSCEDLDVFVPDSGHPQ